MSQRQCRVRFLADFNNNGDSAHRKRRTSENSEDIVLQADVKRQKIQRNQSYTNSDESNDEIEYSIKSSRRKRRALNDNEQTKKRVVGGILNNGNTEPAETETKPLTKDEVIQQAIPAKVPWGDGAPFTQDESFRLLEAYMRTNGFAKHHIDSYDNFVDVQMAQCFSEHPPIDVRVEDCKSHRTFRHEIAILSYRFGEPCLQEADGRLERITPIECMIRHEPYEIPLYIDVEYSVYEIFGARPMEPNEIYRDNNKEDRSHETTKRLSAVRYRDHLFDWLPCMKGSSKCTLTHNPDYEHEDLYDCGGIFLPNGAEKVVVGQEEIRNNYPFVLVHEKTNIHTCECRSYDQKRIRSTSTMDVTLTPPRSCSGRRQTMVPRVAIHIPFLEAAVPLVSVFRLLGVNDIENMYKHICEDVDEPWFKRNVMNILLNDREAMYLTRREVVERIAESSNSKNTHVAASVSAAVPDFEKSERHVRNILANEFLPNQGYADTDLQAKTICFTMMVRKVMRVFYELMPADDRDHYMHRRCKLCGPMMALLARNQLNQFRKKGQSTLRKAAEVSNGKAVDVLPMLKGNIGTHLGFALSTGNFSLQRGQNAMNGVSQALLRISGPFSAISHLRGMVNPVCKESRNTKARLLDTSGLGSTCPYQTPEGQACGLRRNMAMTTGIRVGHLTEILCDMVDLTGMVDIGGRTNPHPERARVFVNGFLIGSVVALRGDPHPEETFVELLKDMRAKQNLPIDVSIYFAKGAWASIPQGEVHISGDAGSYYWPLIRVDRLHILREILDGKHHVGTMDLWQYCLSNRVIELINKDEETISVRLAFYPEDISRAPPDTFTHVCIHPSQILSVITSRGTHLEFNQSPREVYQSCMGKQAIGDNMSNEQYRFEAFSHCLWYSQKPLCSTWTDRQFQVGTCTNVTIAIMSLADNQEDSIIYNRQSINNGLFRSTRTRTVKTIERKHGLEEERIEFPPEGTKSMLAGTYDHIDKVSGVAPIGTKLTSNQVVISKTVHTKMKKKTMQSNGTETVEEIEQVRDRSVACKEEYDSVVQSVVHFDTANGSHGIRVKTASTCIMQEGDKAASRFGQKGVAGAVYEAVDMPFDPETGIIPDIIINSHCQPSRMTIGHLIDTIMATLACATGEVMDGTAWAWSHKFEDDSNSNALIEHLGDMLENYGFDRYCNSRLRCGKTGKLYESPIFFGVCPYQKLKHMVCAKEHARATGPVNILTRQPPEGRGHDGGLRFGEMERDNAISHGTAFTLHDRLMTASDGFTVFVCVQCGQLAQPPKQPAADAFVISATEHGLKPYCRSCNTYENIIQYKLPYVFKLWMQEMSAMAFMPRFVFEKTRV